MVPALITVLDILVHATIDMMPPLHVITDIKKAS